MLNPFRFHDNPGGLLNHFLGTGQRGGIGQLRVQNQVALVLLGNEAGRHFFKSQEIEPIEPCIEHQHNRRHTDQPADQPCIAFTERIEEAVETGEKPAEQSVEQAV